MNKNIVGAILVLLISTFALGCIGSQQQVTPTPTVTVTPVGTTEQITPVGTTEQVTPVGTTVSTTTAVSTTTPMSVAIDIKNSAFNPLTVTIRQGTNVTWTNDDTVAHTVTSVTTGVFDSGIIRPGMTYNHTFDQAGSFEYGCTIHTNIPHGTIMVTSTGLSTSTPTATAILPNTPTPTVTATSTTTANVTGP